MAIKIGALQVDLRLLSTRFTAGMQSASSSITRFSRDARQAAGSIGRVSAGLTAIGGLGGGGLLLAANQAAQLADRIGKTADAVGLTTDAYQELVFVAGRAGIEQGRLNSNLTAFVKRVGEARVQTGPLVSFLQKYDESLLQAIQSTSTQEQALRLVLQAIEDAGSATDRAAIANAAFSRSGVAMVNVVRDGVVEFDALRQRAQELGLVLEESLIRQAETTNDQLSTLASVIRTRLSAALLELAPQIDAIATALIEALPAVTEFLTRTLNIKTPVTELQTAIRDLAAERDQLLTQRVQRTGGVRGFISNVLGLESKEEIETRLNEINQVILTKQAELETLLADQQTQRRAALPDPVEVDTARQDRLRAQQEAELQIERERLAGKLALLEESLLTEEERLALHFERRTALVDQAFADGIIPTEERYREISRQLEQDHQNKLSQISNKGCVQRARFELTCQQQRARNLFRELQAVTSGVAQQNKALFRINQVAAIANATINAFQGASRTLGAYPWPIGPALAAVHLAAGLAQVSAISSASFGSSQPAPSLVGGGAVTGTVPTIQADQFDAGGTTAEAIPREVNITLEGAGFSKQDVRELIEQINEELGDGVTLEVA